jgi:uncharacterized protein YjbI with pentapeptide repeats
MRAADGRPADMRPADMRPADMRPADMRPADMRPADMRPADMRPADMRPADLARFERQVFSIAMKLREAISTVGMAKQRCHPPITETQFGGWFGGRSKL